MIALNTCYFHFSCLHLTLPQKKIFNRLLEGFFVGGKEKGRRRHGKREKLLYLWGKHTNKFKSISV